MAFTQALFERVVQFLTGQTLLALVQKVIHHRLIDLDHLVDDALMRFGDTGKISDAARLEKTVDDGFAVIGRQIDRQAFRAERLAQLFDQCAAISPIDFVDDDDARQAARLGVMHQAMRAVFDPIVRIDHNCTSFHGGECGQRRPAEIRRAGSINQVDVTIAFAGIGPIDRGDYGVERLFALFFHRLVIRNRGAALDGPRSTDHAARMQQGLEQRGLARGRVTDERDVSDAFGGVGHDRSLLIGEFDAGSDSLLLSLRSVKRRCDRAATPDPMGAGNCRSARGNSPSCADPAGASAGKSTTSFAHRRTCVPAADGAARRYASSARLNETAARTQYPALSANPSCRRLQA